MIEAPSKNQTIYISHCGVPLRSFGAKQHIVKGKKMARKSKVLVVGGTGYIGRRLVRASLSQGHQTYVLKRPEIGLDIDKLQILLSFKKQGAHLIEASFSDFQSLVDAVKQVDIVISAMSGVHFRSHNILLQLKLVEAIKHAGNIKVKLIFS